MIEKYFNDGLDNNYYMSSYSTNNSYSDMVDAVDQYNMASAEQAQKQMDFQQYMFDQANEFNASEAEKNRLFQQESANRAMAFSSAENEKNRSWQKMMSDTAHKREMADLKAAGLNPILAANNGASAGVGSAAMSAQAAGSAASSAGTPSGAKADIANLATFLGKMLDNQTELQKMIVSAETARETAELYTSATRYAAELGQAASIYGSDQSYAASLNNPYNLLGNQLGELVDYWKSQGNSASNAYGLGKLGALANNAGKKAKSTLVGFVKNLFGKDSKGTHASGNF